MNTASAARHSTETSVAMVVARWMPSFLGFPIGGLAALTIVGAVDSTPSALIGGAITGAVLGAVQSFAAPALPRIGWAIATAVGLSVGLAIGSRVVDFGTSLGALAVQGAVCGATIGAAQAMLLGRSGLLRDRRSAAWPGYLSACWALGWSITTAAGVDVDRHYTVFGATGAIVVTALTAVLPLALRRTITPGV